MISIKLLRTILLFSSMSIMPAAWCGTISLPVVNPGFEDGLNGWSYNPGNLPSAAFIDTTVAHTGHNSLELIMESGGGGVYQDVPYTLPAGTTFELGFWLLMPYPGSQGNKWFTASFSSNGTPFPSGCPWYGAQDLTEACTDGAILSQATSLSSWTYETLSFTLPSATSSIALQFNTGNGNGSGPAEPLWVDDISLQATPEPCTLTLLVCGLGAGCLCRRSHARQQAE